MEEFENWPDCELDSLARVVPDVIDVLVSPSRVITELCEVSPVGLMWNLWNRSPFLSTKKSAHSCTDKQEEMRYEGSPVEALPLSRRRLTPLTPMQNSYTPF